MVILDLPEFITVAQDEVHVFVEGLEGSNEDPPVLQDAPHPEVDVLQHLTAFPHRLRTGHTRGFTLSFPVSRCEHLIIDVRCSH